MNKAEDQIRRAMEEGQFDNLPGKGKPLRLEKDPFEDPEWSLAHHALRTAGYTLPWIEVRQEIEKDLEMARQELARAWSRRQTASAGNRPAAPVEAEWKRAEEAFRERIGDLNKRILSYNLQVPRDRFQLPLIKTDQEIDHIIG